MKKALQVIVIGGVAAFTMASARAAVYSADATTSPSGTARLFLNSAGTTVAPSGTLMWFVADTTGAGIGALTGNVPLSTFQNIANNIGSLDLIASASTPGNLGAFGAPGTTSFTFANINTSFANDNIYAVLINDRSGAPNAGDTFGTYKIGVAPPPQLGNAQWLISSGIFADQNTITAVPEPATFGAVAGLLCLVGAAARRKLRK